MSQIIQLDPQTANSIAAGEVIERPVSVVKELVENALDAHASVIHVAIRQGGVQLIQVTDNGVGMDSDDAQMAFTRHATSKLRAIDDLDHLLTMGFRGEALASIAAVSEVTLETRQSGTEIGSAVRIKAGHVEESRTSGCPEGTRITVEHLFFNVPARFKFLKKDSTEAGHISTLIERLALARPDVSFRLQNNDQEVLHTPGNNDLVSTVYAVYGRQIAQGCLSVSCTEGPVKLEGLIGRPDIARNNRELQCFFVNGRLIRSKTMTAALDEAFKTQLMKKKYAVAFLFITLPPTLADINVHPQKIEVRFWSDQDVFRCLYRAIQSSLADSSGVVTNEEDVPIRETDRSEPDRNRLTEENAHMVQESDPVIEEKPMVVRERVRQAASDVYLNDDIEQQKSKQSMIGAEKSIAHRQSVLTVEDLSQARLIGSLFQTYILLELGEELLLIDQHAAHEKILFERLIKRHREMTESGKIQIQDLLVPVIIEVSRSDALLIQSRTDELQHFGFSCSMIGPATIAIRSIPDTGTHHMNPELSFRVTLDALRQSELQSDDAIEEIYYQMACKAAVKGKDRLHDQEIRQLISDLQKADDPYHCPHGRPVIIRMGRREIEKQFKRIV